MTISRLALYLSLAILIFHKAVAQPLYIPNTVYVKTTEDAFDEFLNSPAGKSSTNNFFERLQIDTKTPLVSPKLVRDLKAKNNGTLHSQADRIFKLHFKAHISVEKAIAILKRDPRFEVVEPAYIFQILHVPNDPLADPVLSENTNGQVYLHMHRIYDAWDVQKGDTNVIVGVVDSGFDIDHFDLKDNLIRNWADPINGLNDDGDTYDTQDLVDNFHGWDLADADNDVRPGTSAGFGHGTMVLGAISATPENDTGIAGIAFNCRYLPIKAAPDSAQGNIYWGYDGMLLCGQQGAGIINLSWGGTNVLPAIFQEVTTMVALDMDAVIIAAAGNDATENIYYPASFDHVMSVTALASDTSVWSASTHNYRVDVCAHGSYVLTTEVDNSFARPQGTSNAAPVVAGGAALVRAQFPHWNSKQVIQQLRVAGTVVDTLAGNESYVDKIGTMMDVYTALTDTSFSAFRLTDKVIGDGTAIVNIQGDSMDVQLDFVNYLAATKNDASITLEAISDNFEIAQGAFSPGIVETMDSTSTEEAPFRIYVPASGQSQDTLIFKVNYDYGTGQMDHEYFQTILTPSVIASNEPLDPELKLNLFPNPAEEELILTLEEPLSQNSTLEIFAVDGRLMASEPVEAGTKEYFLLLSALSLDAGVYQISVRSETFQSVGKFLKQ